MQLRCLTWAASALMLLGSVGATSATAAEDPIPALIEKLSDSDPNVQLQTIALLGEWGPAAKEAVPALADIVATSEDVGLRHEALVTLGRIGPAAVEAVPTLREALQDESPLIQHEAIHALRQIGEPAKAATPELKALLESDQSFLKVAAAWALSELDPAEETQQQLIPLLVTALQDENNTTRGDAVFALGAIGSPAVPAILKVVASTNINACISGCDALALMGTEADKAVPILLQRLTTQNKNVTWHAAHALGEIGTQPEKVVPALTKLLSHSDITVKTHAAVALGKYGPEAASAVPALAKLLTDKEAGVRVVAASVLGQIGPAAKDAIPALKKAIDDPVGVVTFRALEALGEIGEAAVPTLTELLDQPGLQLLAATILGRIGPDAKAAVPQMAELLSSEDKDFVRELVLALAEIGPSAIAAKPALIDLMKNGTPEAQAGAVFVLAKIGAEDTLPAIQDLLKTSEHPLVRLACAGAIITFNPNHPNASAAIPYFRQALKEGTPLARREVARLLARMGEQGKDAIPELLEVANSDEDPETRTAAMYALAETGASAEDLVPVAIRGLQDPFPPMRTTSAYALSRLGPAAEEAIPALQAMSKSQDTFEQLTGAWALIRIQTDPAEQEKAVLILLEKALSSDPQVRIALAEALGEIGLRVPNAKPILEKLQADEDERVQKAAEQALEKLQAAEKATPQESQPKE